MNAYIFLIGFFGKKTLRLKTAGCELGSGVFNDQAERERDVKQTIYNMEVRF